MTDVLLRSGELRLLIDEISIHFEDGRLTNEDDVRLVTSLMEELDQQIRTYAKAHLIRPAGFGFPTGPHFILWPIAVLFSVGSFARWSSWLRTIDDMAFVTVSLEDGSIILKGKRKLSAAGVFVAGSIFGNAIPESEPGKFAHATVVEAINMGSHVALAGLREFFRERDLEGDGKIDGNTIIIWVRRHEDDEES